MYLYLKTNQKKKCMNNKYGPEIKDVQTEQDNKQKW